MFQIVYLSLCFLIGDIFCAEQTRFEEQKADFLIKKLQNVNSDDEMKRWCIRFFTSQIGLYNDELFRVQDICQLKKIANHLITCPYQSVCDTPIKELDGHTFYQHLVWETGPVYNYVDMLGVCFKNKMVNTAVSSIAKNPNDRAGEKDILDTDNAVAIAKIGTLIDILQQKNKLLDKQGDYINFLPILQYLSNKDLFEPTQEQISQDDKIKEDFLLKTILCSDHAKYNSDCFEKELQNLAENLSNRFTAFFKIISMDCTDSPNMEKLYYKIRKIWLWRLLFTTLGMSVFGIAYQSSSLNAR